LSGSISPKVYQKPYSNLQRIHLNFDNGNMRIAEIEKKYQTMFIDKSKAASKINLQDNILEICEGRSLAH